MSRQKKIESLISKSNLHWFVKRETKPEQERKSTHLMTYLRFNNPQISFINCISIFWIFLIKATNFLYISNKKSPLKSLSLTLGPRDHFSLNPHDHNTPSSRNHLCPKGSRIFLQSLWLLMEYFHLKIILETHTHIILLSRLFSFLLLNRSL